MDYSTPGEVHFVLRLNEEDNMEEVVDTGLQDAAKDIRLFEDFNCQETDEPLAEMGIIGGKLGLF